MRSTFFDEVFIFALFVYVIGIRAYYDFLVIVWDDYALEFLRSKGVINKEQAGSFKMVSGLKLRDTVYAPATGRINLDMKQARDANETPEEPQAKRRKF